jgi:hypothetical protein
MPERLKLPNPEARKPRLNLDRTLTTLPQSLAKSLFEAFASRGLDARQI